MKLSLNNALAMLAYVALALTSACATARPEPVVRTVEVRVPYDDPRCVREALARLGAAPSYPDTDAALRSAETVFRGVQLLQAGRLLRIAREAALTAALEACGR